MISDVEHFLMCLSAIRISSLGTFLFISSPRFLIGLAVFFLWSSTSALYILDIKPLSDGYCVNILSHSVDCLCILVTVSFEVQKLLSLMQSFAYVCFQLLGQWCFILKDAFSFSVMKDSAYIFLRVPSEFKFDIEVFNPL